MTSPLLYLHHQRTTRSGANHRHCPLCLSVCTSALCAVSLFALLLTVPHRMNTERTTAACVSKFGTLTVLFLFLFWWVDCVWDCARVYRGSPYVHTTHTEQSKLRTDRTHRSGDASRQAPVSSKRQCGLWCGACESYIYSTS